MQATLQRWFKITGTTWKQEIISCIIRGKARKASTSEVREIGKIEVFATYVIIPVWTKPIYFCRFGSFVPSPSDCTLAVMKGNKDMAIAFFLEWIDKHKSAKYELFGILRGKQEVFEETQWKVWKSALILLIYRQDFRLLFLSSVPPKWERCSISDYSSVEATFWGGGGGSVAQMMLLVLFMIKLDVFIDANTFDGNQSREMHCY